MAINDDQQIITKVSQSAGQLITEQEFIENYENIKNDAMWRITSGKFYRIMIKDDDETTAADGENKDFFVMQFKPNEVQTLLLNNLWYRNDIPKARQFGITTLFAIMFLDHALFVPNQRCGIIAHNLKAAGGIFQDKVRFAYDGLPEFMRNMFPLKVERADELVFGHNNSSIQVARSLRSGTTHRLHVSEYGKICAESPAHAKEVRTGSIPSVPLNGIITIESTGEGPEGDFYNLTMRAESIRESGRKLNKRDYRLFFIPWWKHNDYRMDPEGVTISPKDDEYFDQIEAECGMELDQEQCAWYVATRDTDYAEEPELMWQEYPSTLAEVFQKSKEGHWFAKQMTAVRKQGRIKTLPVEVTVACYGFWDIGNTDGTAIWILQRVGHEWRCIKFYEAWGEPYAHAVAWLQGLGLSFDTMFLPHDAYHTRQGEHANESPAEMLERLMPGVRFEKVEVIGDITWGIQQTRDVFHLLWFDETECKEGLIHLDGYKKKFDTRQQRFMDVPVKTDGHSEAADALRQFGQAYASGLLNVRVPDKKKKRARNWRTA